MEPCEIQKCNEEGAYIRKIKPGPKWSPVALQPCQNPCQNPCQKPAVKLALSSEKPRLRHCSKRCTQIQQYQNCTIPESIARLKRILCFEDMETVVHAFISSRLHYCTSLYQGFSRNRSEGWEVGKIWICVNTVLFALASVDFSFMILDSGFNKIFIMVCKGLHTHHVCYSIIVPLDVPHVFFKHMILMLYYLTNFVILNNPFSRVCVCVFL